MRCFSSCCLPVRPLLCPILSQADDEDAAAVAAEEAGVIDLRRAAVLGEPIVGNEMVTLDKRGSGAVPFRILPSPRQPTPAQIERHNICHWPYEAW